MTSDLMIPCPKGCGVSVHPDNVGFHVCRTSNQRVRLLIDIYDDGADHHPPGYIARKGEVLVVRTVRALCVSHEGVEHRQFVVREGEFELITPVETTQPLDAEFFAALDRCDTKEPLQVYDSNSWRRIGLASQYKEVVYPERQRSDGHLSISNTGVLRAMVAAFNAMLARRSAVEPTPPHTTEDDFQHWLSYSGRRWSASDAALRAAYYAGADVSLPENGSGEP
jgi:hypothetical protein